MPDSNKFIRLTLESKKKYECLMSPEYFLIEVIPENEFLINKNLNDIYCQFADKIKISNLSVEDPPLLVAPDIYKKFININPGLKYLEEKFECYLL
jgi:hypothetical protein